MRLLDRYILSSFLVPFFYCFAGFVGIWLIFDLSDNGADFIEARLSPLTVAYFYGTQLPQTMLICLPVGLLLALLYCLSRMSRANEIISMLTAGVSIPRLLLPLAGVGLAATAVALALNYELAPRAEVVRKQLLEQLVHGRQRRDTKVGILFRNRKENRTWFIRRLVTTQGVLEGVHVTQQDAQGIILSKTYIKRATFDPATGNWTLERGRTVHFTPGGDVARDDLWLDETRIVSDWRETPWRMAAANLAPEGMTVPELRDYLDWNADFPAVQLAPFRTHLQFRWALPWSCFIVIFIAAPLGIVFSRRGVLAGVASSIVIFFAMVFLTQLFLALGKGAHVPPAVAAWTPNLLFATIGLFLLCLRASNREFGDLIPKRRPSRP